MKEMNVLEARQMMFKASGSLAILDAIMSENVETIFGYPGGAIMPVYDALYDYQDKLEHILVRHEQGAIHAAQGYARASGKTGVVLATSGPGATNLITGLADALIDSTPLVCVTGQVYAHLLGTDAFQETDVINITSPVTKWNYQVTDANELPEVMAKAFYLASSGRPGPVLIDVTKDAQLQLFDYKGYSPCVHVRSYRRVPPVNAKRIKQAAEMINAAKRPFVLFGQGVSLGNAEEEFKNFVEKSGIPSAWTILGMGALPTHHPLGVGMLGMHGNYGPNVLTNECDVLIAVGMRFDDRVTGTLDKYAKQAKVIHLDIDSAEIGKNVVTDIPVIGDCKETLPALTELIERREHPEWLARFKMFNDEEKVKLINKEKQPTEGKITMAEVLHQINQLSDGNAVFVSDVGQHQMVVCRYAELNNSRSNITSGGIGTMGFALPAAIGAKYGCPDKTVFAIMGDGGAQMNIQELGTIMQFHAEIKIIILNNSFLGMVRQWQELFHEKRYSFTSIESPDFVALAKAYNIEGCKVTDRNDLRSSLQRMIDYPGSFLMEVEVEQQENVFPMVPQGKGVSEIVLSPNDI